MARLPGRAPVSSKVARLPAAVVAAAGPAGAAGGGGGPGRPRSIGPAEQPAGGASWHGRAVVAVAVAVSVAVSVNRAGGAPGGSPARRGGGGRRVARPRGGPPRVPGGPR